MIWLWFPILLLGAGPSGEEQVNSELGDYAFFRVRTNVSIDSISWSKIVSGNSENIAVVTAGKPCGLRVPLPGYETRVNVSKDCRSLYLERTEKEDAGRYTAEVISQNNTAVTESFDLRVFRVAKTEYVYGIYGESLVFQVKNNLPFVSINWLKIVEYKFENISLVTFGQPCGLLVIHPDVKNRVRAAEDCSGLQLSPLEQDDRGYYFAGIVLTTGETIYEPFKLEIDRYLRDSQMRVTCTPVGALRRTWQLSCSTGDEKDRVEFDWESPIYRPSIVPHPRVITVKSRDLNVNVTCTAENRISKASRRVSLKDVCSVTSREQQVNSRLGGYAFFRVTTNVSIESISWSKIVSGNSENIAVVTVGEPCGLLVPYPAYETRVRVTNDCGALFFKITEEEDAGRYTAEVISQNNTAVNESFDLRLFLLAEREDVNGIYGESLVFQVKTDLSFVSINWFKIVEFDLENISLVTFGQPCGLLVIHPDFENRVKASEDCNGLQLGPLEQDDRGDYFAEIVLTTGEMIYEPFELKIDRYLRDSEMRVTCTPVGARRRTWQLSCSTGDEKDRVEFNWESPIYRPFRYPHPRVIKVKSRDLKVMVTCTAENRISKASRRVSLKDVCSGHGFS